MTGTANELMSSEAVERLVEQDMVAMSTRTREMSREWATSCDSRIYV